MATNIDKALPVTQDPDLQIDIVPDEPVDVEIELEPDGEGDILVTIGEDIETETPEDFNANLAEYMDDTALNTIASDLVAAFDKDVNDRSEWARTYADGMKLLGLQYEEKNEPWPGACGVFHPMLAEAVVRFQSEAMTETFPAAGPVKTQIIGKETPEKRDAAIRVREDMNYQLTEVMPEYRTEHERLLWSLPIAGSAFKKVFDDPALGRQVSLFVPAEDLLLPYGASTIQNAQRITHVMRMTKNELRKLQVSGFYRDVELGDPTGELDDIQQKKAELGGMDAIQDDRYRVLEMHVELDLSEHGWTDPEVGDSQGVAVPYVVTVEKSTCQVLSIRRNWLQGDEHRVRREHFAHYQYVPGDGVYGYGLLHLIGGYAKSATLLLRQLVDAGTLSNLPGGLKSVGLRVKGESTPIAPGEFRDVDVPSGTIKDNILPLPYKEPSAALAALLERIIGEGRAFASGGDLKVSDMSAQAPVGTTMALLERTLKVMTAIQARLHNAMRHELKMLKAVIAESGLSTYVYEPTEGQPHSRKADYSMVEVLPVSDPNAATMAQKIVQYQAALQLAQGAPQIYNMPLLHRQMLEVLGIKNAAKLVPLEEDAEPCDPVQENMNILTNKPVKAFLEQDHKAHLAVHLSAIKDPMILELVGQSPNASAIQAAAMAHIQEHLAFEYRRQIEERLGLPLPTEEENKTMDPSVAARVAQMAAQAAQQVLQNNQQQAAQQKAQEQAQDPVVQLQMRKMAVEEGKLQLAAQEQQRKAQEGDRKLFIEEAKAKLDAMLEVMRAVLDERKQTATEELNEQSIALKALHYGNMGRAQDQQILQADRDRAMEAMKMLMEIHARNNLGESRKEKEDGAASIAAGAQGPAAGPGGA